MQVDSYSNQLDKIWRMLVDINAAIADIRAAVIDEDTDDDYYDGHTTEEDDELFESSQRPATHPNRKIMRTQSSHSLT